MFLLPSFITFLNLAAGVASIIMCLEGHVQQACLLVFAGVLLDSLDGWTARVLDCETDFGKIFDSISDFVSFGLAPACIALNFLPNTAFFWAGAALYIFCSGFRLLRFHRTGMIANEEGVKHFEGLPITFSGGFLSLQTLLPLHPFQAIFLSLSMALLSFLMISRIPIRKPSLRR